MVSGGRMTAPLLITGGTGQVAQALTEQASRRGMAARTVGRPDFDFDRPESIDDVFAATRPRLVINAAAYTAVDAAEDDEAAAFRANRDGPARLAALAAAAGIPLIHISTDYVFDGTKGAPYVETDPTAPTGLYGASKLAGEAAVLASGARALILRTSWVYAARGRNFVRTMLAAAAAGRNLRVVADQRGAPTAAEDLASLILDLVTTCDAGAENWGLYHAAGAGEANWHEFAVAIFAEAARYGVPTPPIAAIATKDWPTRARRPADSRLACGKLARVFGLALPPWRESLARVVATLCAT